MIASSATPCIDLRRLEALRAAGAVPKSELLSPQRVLARMHGYTVLYGPFDAPPSPTARLMLIGLTPGLTQLEKANEVLAEIEASGMTDPREIAALRRSRVAFFGTMRNNLVAMLDDLGLPALLGIDRSDDLFTKRADLLFTTSALRYPVFVGDNLRNYGGSGGNLMERPLFQEMVEQFLAPQLDAMPQALLLPLGVATESALTWLHARGHLDGRRIVRGFPHPSGGNGHRVAQFRQNFDDLKAQLRNWFTAAT